MHQPIRHITIVGGGTAGWLSACILAKTFNTTSNNNIRITVVESPDIATVGVGEGTVPTMRSTIAFLGFSETVKQVSQLLTYLIARDQSTAKAQN